MQCLFKWYTTPGSGSMIWSRGGGRKPFPRLCQCSKAELSEWSELILTGVQDRHQGPSSCCIFNFKICIFPLSWTLFLKYFKTISNKFFLGEGYNLCKVLYFNLYKQDKLWLESIWCRSIHIRRQNIKWNDKQSETRRIWKIHNIHAEHSEAGNFEKYKIRALKFIV